MLENDKPNPEPPIIEPSTQNNGYIISIKNNLSSIQLDSLAEFSWSTGAVADSNPVQISLYQNDIFITTLSNNYSGFTYSFSPKEHFNDTNYNFGAGSQYRIKISSVIDANKSGFSPFFALTSPYSASLSFITPRLGQEVYIDSNLSAQWKVNGNPGNTLILQLYQDSNYVSTLSRFIFYPEKDSTLGQYDWYRVKSKNGSGSNYSLKILSKANPAIFAFSPKFRITSIYTGKLDILDNSTDTLVPGSFVSVNWQSTGIVGKSLKIELYQDSTYIRTLNSSISIDNMTYSWFIPSGLAWSNKYKIKITSLSDPNLYTFSKNFLINGIIPDSYENDDSLSGAKAIEPNGIGQARTISSSDIDWISLQTQPGKHYVISLMSDFGVNMALYDSLKRPLDTLQSQSLVQKWLKPSFNGKHYIRVTPYSSYGSYSLVARELDTSDLSLNLKFQMPNTESLWSIGSNYKVEWVPDTLFYRNSVELSLYLDTMLVSKLSSSAINNGAFSWTLNSNLYTSSRYRIKIQSLTHPQIFSFSSYFSISGQVRDVYEPDNYVNQAKIITPLDSLQKRTASTLDNDWISFQTQANKSYLLLFNSRERLTAQLFDSIGSLSLAQNSGTYFSLIHKPSNTGKLMVKVSTNLQATEYGVRLLELGQNFPGFSNPFTSPDSASIWATSSSYSLKWLVDSSLYGPFVALDLLEDSTLIYSISSSVPNNGSYTWTLPTGLASSNRYRIKIKPSLANSPIFALSNPFNISGLSPDIYEPDNHKQMAKTFLPGDQIYTRNLTLNDTDWFSIEGKAGYSYYVGVGPSSNYTLKSLDSLNNPLAASTSFLPQVIKPNRNGKFYLLIHSNSFNQSLGNYTLTIKEVPTQVYGMPFTFISPLVTDTLTAGLPINLKWNPDTLIYGHNISLDLYKDSTLIKNLSTRSSHTSGLTVPLPSGLGTGSNYRIKVTSGFNSAVYGFTAPLVIRGMAPDMHEPNDSVTQAVAITPNLGKKSLSLPIADKDWFSFTCSPGLLYLFRVSSNSLFFRPGIKIYSSNGSSLLHSYQSNSTDMSHSLTWSCTQNQSYKLLIDASQTTLYDFEFKSIDPNVYKYSFTKPLPGSISVGSALVISWTDSLGVGGSVDLFLFNAKGLVQTLATDLKNVQTFTWNVPATYTVGTGYYIRLVSKTNSLLNGNSPSFNLVAPIVPISNLTPP